MELPLFRFIYFATACYCFIALVLVHSQSTPTVIFFAPKTILASGEEKVFFLCRTDSFDENQDFAELFFQSNRLLRFNHGTAVYYHTEDRPHGYYTTAIFNHPDDGPVGVGITINKIHTNDSGEYYCVITKNEVPHTSDTINLTVEPIPKPTCKVQNSTDVLYMVEGQNGRMVAMEGANSSLTCQIDTASNSIPISLLWTRSDNFMFRPNVSDVLNISVTHLSEDDNVVFTCTSKVNDPQIKSFTETCHISLHVTNESFIFSTISPTISETKLPIVFIIGLSGGACVLCSLLIIIIVFLCFRSPKINPNRSKEENVEFINEDGNRESSASRFSRISSKTFQFDTVADSNTTQRNETTFSNSYEGNEMIDIAVDPNQLEYTEEMYDSTPDSNAYTKETYNNADSYYGNTDQNVYGNTENDENVYGNTDIAENMYGNADYTQNAYGNTENAQETHQNPQEIYQNTDQALNNGYPQDLYENSADTYPNNTSQRGTGSLLKRPIYAHVNKSKSGAPSVVSDFSDDSIPPYAAVERGRDQRKAKSVFARNTSQYADVNDMPVPPRSSSLRRLNMDMGLSEYSSVC